MRWIVVAVVVAAAAWGVLANLPEAATASASGLASPHHALAPSSNLVRGIALDGGRGLPLAELRAVIGTKVGAAIDEKQLAADRDAVEAELAERGYLAAKVADPVVTYANGGVYVVFDVQRGPMFRLRSVTITGPGQGDGSIVTIAAGDPAIQSRMAQARASLETSLSRNGKPAAVSLVVHSDRDAAVVDVDFITR